MKILLVNDDGINARLATFFAEVFEAVVKNWVEIAHENHGNLNFRSEILEFVKNPLQAHSLFQRLRGSMLNDRSVGERVAERNAHFHHVNSLLLQGTENGQGGFGSGVTGTEID